jgi:hypothetical protein
MKEHHMKEHHKKSMHHSGHSKSASGSMDRSDVVGRDNSSYTVGAGGHLSHYLKGHKDGHHSY